MEDEIKVHEITKDGETISQIGLSGTNNIAQIRQRQRAAAAAAAAAAVVVLKRRREMSIKKTKMTQQALMQRTPRMANKHKPNKQI